MRNIAAKKGARQEDLDSDYLFNNANREIPKISNEWLVPTLARHNPRFDRLSLFGCLHKSLGINGFHHTHKLNYKEELVRKSHRVSNAIGESGIFDGAATKLSFL